MAYMNCGFSLSLPTRGYWVFRNSLALAFVLLFALPATGETLRDPTRPLKEAAPLQRHEPSFQLNAILSGQQRSNVAIINGKTVTEGDSVEGAKVIRILPDRVSLRHGGQSLELRLHTSSVRSDALTYQPAVRK